MGEYLFDLGQNTGKIVSDFCLVIQHSDILTLLFKN